MNTRELAEPAKNSSWIALISEMEVGDKINIALFRAKTIRPLISGRVADRFPERAFITKKTIVGDQEVLIVKRILDKLPQYV